ncbi:MAG: hypothetical protein JWR42_23 [Marmoricola sp.]|nr:hypothetical protein [Marmoricola sp.]
MSTPTDPTDPRDPREPQEPATDRGEGGEGDGQADTTGDDAGGGTDQPAGQPTGQPTDQPTAGSSPGEDVPDPARDEDALWRAIVENYGERARLDHDGPGGPGRSGGPGGPDAGAAGPTSPAAPTRPSRPSTRSSTPRPGASGARPPSRGLRGEHDLPAVPPSLRDLDGPTHREPPEGPDDTEHFVPPPPPPVPVAAPPRLLAWIGLFGVPVLVLVALVIGRPVPSWLGLLLTLWFVGGFVFLVASMRPGPRDEDDDGAVL